MNMKDPIDLIGLILVVIGAINWGLVGAANIDLVKLIFTDAIGMAILAQIVYIIVGLAGLYTIYAAFVKKK